MTTPSGSAPAIWPTAPRWPTGSRERLHLTRGAVLYLNDQYGRGIRQTFVREFLRLGGELESIDPYLGATPDVGPYLDRLARSRPAEFLVVAGNRGRGGGDHPPGPSARARPFRCWAATGSRASTRPARSPKACTSPPPYFPRPWRRTRTGGSSRPIAGSIRAPGIPNQPAAATYDAVYLLREVIARAGSDRAAVRRVFAGVGSATPPFEGVTGTVAFDAAGDVPNQNVYIGVVRKGAVIVAEDATETVAQVP